MKPNNLLALITLGLVSASACAAVDHNYYIADSVVKQRLEVFNDGKNTFIKAVSGLIVRGATADGERFIVQGVPQEIPAQMSGRQITITRGIPPVLNVGGGTSSPADSAAMLTRINQLSAEVSRLSKGGPSDVEADAPVQQPAWQIKAGGKIVEALTLWSKGKWQVVSVVADRTSDIEINLKGNLEDAIGDVINGVNQSGASWGAVFYPDVKVLRILEKK